MIHRLSTARATLSFLGAMALCVGGGCTAAHHRKVADKQVYGIIRQTEQNYLGETNAFLIDTRYSARKPEEISPEELIGDRMQTNRRFLTLEAALSLAVTNSRDYQARKETLFQSALTLTERRHDFAPQLAAGSEVSLHRTGEPRTHKARITVINTNGYPESSEVTIQDSPVTVSGSAPSTLQVSQLLKSGGTLTARLVNDLFRYYTGDPQRSAVSTITVNLVQPLLRGFGRNNPSVESLKQAERNVVYAVRDFSHYQNQFAMEVVNAYFRLLESKDVVRNRYTNYLGRARLTARMEARARDREQLNAVDQARQAELTARNTYVNQVAAYQTALDNFKIRLGLPISERMLLDDSALVELREAGLVSAPVPAEQAYHLATDRQLQVLNAIDRYEDSKRKVRVAADRLKADLTLLADASLRSDGATDYTKFNPDNVRAGVGLSLNLPIDRVAERNTYRATLISFEAQLRALTLVLDTLRNDIDDGARALNLRRQNYQIQRNALELANRRVTSTTLLLQAGRAEVRDVSEAQDAQISAQNAVTSALVAYQEARLQLLLDIGALKTEQPRFWLQDHLAPFLGTPTPPTPLEDAARQPVAPPQDFFKN